MADPIDYATTHGWTPHPNPNHKSYYKCFVKGADTIVVVADVGFWTAYDPSVTSSVISSQATASPMTNADAWAKLHNWTPA